ncbi:beta-ketoacyl synthase N-terminal-like domain-containing protein [Actinomadura sp. NTSP31]|uniref:beta-ketoacyl synthase N-terminal-like domain-containing protein n=1 Tax=Actinomadura sp. NTSP31 TaxID=1735447 RepID=UPI0035BFAFDB
MTAASITERLHRLSPGRRAEVAARMNRAAEAVLSEPIALVGIGCRFPGGVSGPRSYWRNLLAGWNAVRDVPSDRWDVDTAPAGASAPVPGRATSRRGGFLDDVAGFDAEHFKITPQEAAAMDPQQRLLLEVAWEALDDAGLQPPAIAGSRTGVFVGVYYNDYLRTGHDDIAAVDAYTTTGNAHSVTAGRLSYLLDLSGPCMAVDTACSSSLVAVHLACQSLRLRECDTALAGGVSLMLAPETQVALSQWGMLSPKGRCGAFDADADGIVRGEGAGVIVLKRLVDAVTAGDQVVAVLRGSATNQDGRSQGLTAPSVLAQRDVLSEALAKAGIAPSSVGFIETHGTGTSLGDPIEFDALSMVYGRDGGRCALGSVKTNMGHLEAAAGIAGLIKAALVVRSGVIPPNLHFRRWNAAIDPGPTGFYVPTEATRWDAAPHPRVAAVSSFGFGGTNAHLLIEEARLDTGARPLPGEDDTTATAADDPLPIDRWRHERFWRGRTEPSPPSGSAEDGIPPTSGDGVVEILQDVFQRALGRRQVRPQDNFFELGGDSLTAMRVVSMARERGVHLRVEDLREASVAGMVGRLASAAASVASAAGVDAASEVPLTPVQYHYLHLADPAPEAWDTQALLDCDERIDPDLLLQAASRVVDRHDALRLRLARTPSGWRQTLAPPGSGPAPHVESLDLSRSSDVAALAMFRSRAGELQAARDLRTGPLVSLVVGDRGPGRPSSVLVSVHHLAVDGHSIWMLIYELFTAYRALSESQPVELPEPTTPYAVWARQEAKRAASGDVRAQLAYWAEQDAAETVQVPVNHDHGPALLGSMQSSTATLDASATSSLLAVDPDLVPLLLTALLTSLSDWVPEGEIRVDLRDHGRRSTSPDLDLAWTMGWFTSVYPVVVPIGPSVSLEGVRRRLTGVPDHGSGYGALRHLTEEGARDLTGRSEISVNYTGRLDGGAGGPVRYAATQARAFPDRRIPISRLIELKAVIIGDTLHTTLAYSRDRFRADFMDAAAGRLVAALHEHADI